MSTRSRLILLVGGDSEAARSCARAAAPLPIVRAKHLTTATSRLRSMKPLALVVAADVPPGDVIELERIATEQSAMVVHLERDETSGAPPEPRSSTQLSPSAQAIRRAVRG